MRDTTTPTKVTPEIIELCQSIQGSQPPPYYVNVRPVSGAYNECINHVNDMVKANGGSVLIGWIIWEWAYTLVEAELHAIWVTPTGEQIDISPKQDGEKRILFLPDPDRKFPEKAREPNRRRALRDHPKIQEFFTLSDQRQAMMPPPGQAISIGPNHPMVALERKLVPLMDELRRMANARKRSKQDKR
jgi:hypothetical protein